MSRQRMLEEWEKFSGICVAEGTSSVDRMSLKMAFFAGALALYSHALRNFDRSQPMPTDEDFDMMREIIDELKSFRDQLLELAKATGAAQ